MIERYACLDKGNGSGVAGSNSHLMFKPGNFYPRGSTFHYEGSHSSASGAGINCRPNDDESLPKFFIFREGFIATCNKDLFTVEDPFISVFIKHRSGANGGVV